jgi:hypothetical protein
MNCPDVKKLLIPFIESSLSEREMVIVEAHLYSCDDCRKEKELLEKTWSALDGFKAPQVSSNFTWNLMQRIRGQEQTKPRFSFNLPEINIQFGFRVLVPVLVTACVLIAVYSFVLDQPVPLQQFAKVVATEKKTEIEHATVTYLTGTVKVLLSGQQEYAQAQEGMALQAGDTVATDSEGAMEISFDAQNNKIVRVQANTKVAMTFQGSEKMMLSEGEVFATINALPEHAAFEIRTPTAVSGARGTAWTTRVDAEGTTVESVERTPYIKSIEADGRVSDQETKVEAGYYTVVEHVQKPQPVRPIPTERMAQYASLKDDVRRHASQDLIVQRDRPKFDRDDFIKRSTGENAQRMAPRVDDNHPRAKELEQGRFSPQDKPGELRETIRSGDGSGGGPGANRGNSPGPQSGPGAGPEKRVQGGDNSKNPPGPRGNQGTRVEDRPSPQGGAGAGPDRRGSRGDNDTNYTGPGSGQGTNVENRPRPQGGPGAGPDRKGPRGDNDTNSTVSRGGQQANVENRPGPQGGPGAGPDRKPRMGPGPGGPGQKAGKGPKK